MSQFTVAAERLFYISIVELQGDMIFLLGITLRIERWKRHQLQAKVRSRYR